MVCRPCGAHLLLDTVKPRFDPAALLVPPLPAPQLIQVAPIPIGELPNQQTAGPTHIGPTTNRPAAMRNIDKHFHVSRYVLLINLGRASRGPVRAAPAPVAHANRRPNTDRRGSAEKHGAYARGTGSTKRRHGACRPIPLPPTLRGVAIRHFGAPGLSPAKGGFDCPLRSQPLLDCAGPALDALCRPG